MLLFQQPIKTFSKFYSKAKFESFCCFKMILSLHNTLIIPVYRIQSPQLISSESERVKVLRVISGLINGGMSCG